MFLHNVPFSMRNIDSINVRVNVCITISRRTFGTMTPVTRLESTTVRSYICWEGRGVDVKKLLEYLHAQPLEDDATPVERGR